ncbi:MAG: ADP-forming succinate--CoA ligase subunit beta [SAR202 cluster bacterium]|jgi:succinyl-CoA synthetase beta subunit|nr:MAG: ADP-forming succinate--CoA ligase subunit beta [SAR202 cluster bacterium]MCH2319762.1 ADP-forming succinate--CoA ligase subunit beta [SAR202 cluster bacterium]MED5428803.1 ADP-forming succinate--CoA ligase subunit beta [Chloroflexota bacterium]MQG75235.1 ADP-forming succinate--CoA ligase subunit beta [SAR202 cluster bacterium]|tara:strand:+ start:1157 stop:2314 length:1158 start_codon:yes stop_codon:yes gene_type:complete
MKLHEFQSKEILSEYGIPVPRGKVARTPSQAATAAFDLGGTIVVKAQVHAGGRGNAGGIKVVNTPGAAEEAAASMLGTNLITHQTGPEGVPVQNVLIEEGLEVAEELYLGLVIDGSTKGVVVIASKSGGVNIEEVAENDPEKIIQIPIDPVLGLQGFQGRQIAYALGLSQKQVRIASSILESLYRVFIDVDASLLEINPLVITTDGELVAADAKINIDDDAVYRHKNIQNMADPSQEDPLEVQARESDINYVKLDGNIGCIVNGAGLAMATMDVSSAAKAAPANFLDIGGGADEEKVAKALTLVLSDPNVKAVLVNLFGGILRCDIAARGFVMAIERNPELERPMVIRMLGTNSEEGREILASSSLKVTIVETLDEAAEAISKLS